MRSLALGGIGVGFAGMVGLLLYLWRVVRSRRHDRERLRECLAERERIVRELHDTLLQNTQGFILTVQAAASRLPVDDPVRRTLDEALLRADALMIESRDRIQAVRPAAGGTPGGVDPAPARRYS